MCLLIYYVIYLYNSIVKSTYMCFLKDFNDNRPRLALILRLRAIVGVDMLDNSKNYFLLYNRLITNILYLESFNYEFKISLEKIKSLIITETTEYFNHVTQKINILIF